MKRFLFLFFAVLGLCAGYAQGGYDPQNPGDPNPFRRLTMSTEPRAGGTVSPGVGSRFVEVGKTVYCYAYARDWYDFVHWVRDGEIVSTDRSYSFTMPDADVNIVAVFNFNYDPNNPADPEQPRPWHKVTLKTEPEHTGSFNSSSFWLQEGDSVNVYTWPHTGYRFSEWLMDGVVVSRKNPLKVKMGTANLEYTAAFVYDPESPADPMVNMFNPATGLMVIDHFTPGRLSDAIYNELNKANSSSEMVNTLIVAGVMENYDFTAYYLPNVTVLDYSRVNGVDEVPAWAFEYLQSLTEVILPSCISSLSYSVFYGCENLSQISCYAVVPPKADDNTFYGTNSDLVIRVPAQSVDLYKKAPGWCKFTILPLDSNLMSVIATLPADGSDGRYHNMSIELVNTANNVRYKYLITDKLTYMFGNLLSNTSYSLSVRNAKGDALGVIEPIDVVDSDVEVAFESLLQPCTLNVAVTAPDGTDMTKQVTVKWYDVQGRLLQQGANLAGILEGTEATCQVTLPQSMLATYRTPESLKVVAAPDSKSLACVLEAISMVTLTGCVTNADGTPVSNAILAISQIVNGVSISSTTAQNDINGRYTIEVPDVTTKISVSATGYLTHLADLESASDGMGDVSLEKAVGKSIFVTLDYKRSVAPGQTDEADALVDESNIAYRIEDATGAEIADCVYQGSTIILPLGTPDGEVVNLVAYSKNGKFADVRQGVTVQGKSNFVTVPVVEYGKISARTASEGIGNMAMLYGANGEQVSTAAFREGEASFESLPAGAYTLVAMKKSSLFNSVLNLSALASTSLVAGSDYLKQGVNVASGVISTIDLGEIPAIDETKLYYTDSEATYFMPNKSEITIGNYLTIKSKVELKPQYASTIDAATLVVDLPENCEFVENSVISGRGYMGYSLEGNRLSVPMQLGDAVRFCIIPLEGGECKPNAFVQMVIDNRQVLQPIGSACFQAKNFSLAAPVKTSKTTLTLRGAAMANSDVAIYDNGTLVGSARTMPNGTWTAKVSLAKPYTYSIHELHGEVATPEGRRLLTQTRIVDYNKAYNELTKVTMVFNNYTIVFDHINGTASSRTYSYVPGKGEFTFIADFEDPDTAKIKNVVIKVLASDGTTRKLQAEYNAPTRSWVATSHYNKSSKIPVNATATYDIVAKTAVDYDRIADGVLEELQFIVDLSNDIKEDYMRAEVLEEDHMRFVYDNPDTDDAVIIDAVPAQLSDVQALIARGDYAKQDLDDGSTICFADSVMDDCLHIFVWDPDLETLLDVKYVAASMQNGQQRIAPAIILYWIVKIGFATYDGLEIAKELVYIENWRQEINYAQQTLDQQYAYLIRLLSAKCSDGSLKIPITSSERTYLIGRLMELSANSKRFYREFNSMVDSYRDFMWITKLTSLGVGLFAPGGEIAGKYLSGPAAKLMGKLGSAFSGKISQEATKCILEIVNKAGGEAVASTINTILSGRLQKFLTKGPDAVDEFFNENYMFLLSQHAMWAEYIPTVYIDCPKDDDDDDDDDDEDDGDDYPVDPITPSIDPSGYVYEAVPANRIPGVTATAYFMQQTEDMYGDIHEEPVVWDAEPFGQQNPLLTDEQGMYAWDVPAGLWQVKFEKEGYETTYSEWLPVPPPQLDVNVNMTQIKQPEVTSVHAYPDGITIEFDKFMLPSSLAYGNISVTQDGNVVSGELALLDTHADAKGNAVCTKVEFRPDQELAEGEITLFVSKAVKSYADIAMAEDFSQQFAIEPRISQILVTELVEIPAGSTRTVQAEVIPVSAAKGKTVIIESLNNAMISVGATQAVIDDNGMVEFDVTGLIIGSATIKLSVDGYDCSTLVQVSVTSSLKLTANPVASVLSGEVIGGTEVTLECSTPGAVIYYTLDGSCPCYTETALVYDGTPIVINESTTLKVMAKAPNMSESEVVTYAYVVVATGITSPQTCQVTMSVASKRISIAAADEQIEQVTIVDGAGLTVYDRHYGKEYVEIDLQYMPSGMYIALIRTAANGTIRKFILR